MLLRGGKKVGKKEYGGYAGSNKSTCCMMYGLLHVHASPYLSQDDSRRALKKGEHPRATLNT